MITVYGKQVGTSTTEGTIRQHTVLVDRPETKGGSDKGPMGGELLLMALCGCFSSNLLAAIDARNAEISDVQFKVSGKVADAPSRFAEIEMQVSANYKDRELMEKLVQIAEKSCLVANTLKQSVSLQITVTEALGEEKV